MEVRVATGTINSQALNNLNLNNQAQPLIRPTSSSIEPADRWSHFLARCGFKRGGHRVEPGLYALGSPTPDSPVFVSANYRLSFDKLRSALTGIDGYILVLDTRGINVWCAAGKGTFGTDELVNRIQSTRLSEVIRHRNLILPQLGAPGVAAHEVKKKSGFRVEYGPVRADDLPEYLETHKADPRMRKVRFNLRERVVLIPVELVKAMAVVVVIAAAGIIFKETLKTLPYEAITAMITGIVLFPILLPWIPTADFAAKGFIIGAVAVLPFALVKLFSPAPDTFLWLRAGRAFTVMLIWPPLTSFICLNFTGSSTFTSKSGVRKEIFKYTPVMAGMFVSGILIAIVLKLIEKFGG
jgi:hypothetical protein